MPPQPTNETPEPIPDPGDATAPVTKGVPQHYPLEIDDELEDSSPPGREAPPIPMRLVVRGRGQPLPYEGREIDGDVDADDGR